MIKYLFSIVFILCNNIADCKIVSLFHMLDKHVPNVFVRWSGIVVNRSWEEIIKNEIANVSKLTGLDRRFGKKYSYEICQDYACGINPNTDFKNSCVEILKELNIYKNLKIVEKLLSREQLSDHKKQLSDFVNGSASLETIQIGYITLACKSSFLNTSLLFHNLKSFLVNMIFKSMDVFYSVVIEMPLSDNGCKSVIKSINAKTVLPLVSSNKNSQQVLRLQIADVQQIKFTRKNSIIG